MEKVVSQHVDFGDYLSTTRNIFISLLAQRVNFKMHYRLN